MTRALLIAATLLALTGCQGLFAKQGLPPDPLFLEKAPLEAKAVLLPATAPSYSEPQPPSNPYFTPEPGHFVKGVPTRSGFVPAAATSK